MYNLTVPLIECTREEQWSVIKVLDREHENQSNIGGITSESGGNYINQIKVYRWVHGFKGGWTNVVDNARFGQPLTVVCVTVKK